MKLKRIDKRVARRLAESSDEVTVYVSPVKLDPRYYRARIELGSWHSESFDAEAEMYQDLMCGDEVSGRYLAYYIEDTEDGE